MWGKTFRHLSQHLPQVFAHLSPSTNWSPLFVDTIIDGRLHIFFQRIPACGRNLLRLFEDVMTSAPFWLNLKCGNSWGELSALSNRGVLGRIKKPQEDIPGLLIALGRTVKGKATFGLATVWTHMHQVHLPFQLGWQLALCLCNSMRILNMCPPPKRVTLVPWLMGHHTRVCVAIFST